MEIRKDLVEALETLFVSAQQIECDAPQNAQKPGKSKQDELNRAAKILTSSYVKRKSTRRKNKGSTEISIRSDDVYIDSENDPIGATQRLRLWALFLSTGLTQRSDWTQDDQLDKATEYYMSFTGQSFKRELLDALLDRHAEELRKERHNLSPDFRIPTDTFLRFPIKSVETLRSFIDWLQGFGNLIGEGRTLMELRPPEAYFDTPARSASRELLFKQFRDSTQPIHVVKIDGALEAQHAFVRHLLRDRYAELRESCPGLEVCYLPLTDRKVVDFATLVARALAFFTGRDMATVRGAGTQSDLLKQIVELRRRATQSPTLFIFDSWSETVPGFPSLEAAIRDNPLPEFLRQLLLPCGQQPTSNGQIVSSRFLVIGQTGLSVCRSNQNKQISLPGPDVAAYLKNMSAVLSRPRNSTVFQHRDVIKREIEMHTTYIPEDILGIYDTIQAYPTQERDHIDALRDALAAARGANDGRDLDEAREIEARDNHLLDTLTRQLRDGLLETDDKIAPVAIFFLLLTFSGLRARSCVRLLFSLVNSISHLSERERGVWFHLYREDLGTPEELRESVNRIFKGMSGLISRHEDADQQSLDYWDMGLDDHGFTVGDDGKPALYQFRSSRVRQRLLAHFLDRTPSAVLGLMHLLIANEALRQGHVMLEHHALTTTPSLWDMRRSLEGVFHGILSLSISERLLDKARQNCLTNLPVRRLDLFKELVADRYMRVLEGGSPGRKFWPISPYFTPFHFDENCNLIRVFEEFSCALVFHHIPP